MVCRDQLCLPDIPGAPAEQGSGLSTEPFAQVGAGTSRKGFKVAHRAQEMLEEGLMGGMTRGLSLLAWLHNSSSSS